MLYVIAFTEKISPLHVRRCLESIRKVSKPHRMIAQRPAPSPHNNETAHTTKKLESVPNIL